MVPSGATCAAHSATAVDTCERCGVFLCEACLNFADTSPLCDRCHELRVRTKPSGRAIAALLLGIVGIHCMFPLGLLGWALAVQERIAIDDGKAPSAGQSLTTAAKVFGIINLVALIATAIFAIAIFSKSGRHLF